ncbi:MAG: oligosaccharide flippase family protein [Candidatus Omnitrophota bacterium]|nr:MAG: oligosaccharide flippase family protein [Candidatus Omnitrophota bacterium]
MIKRFKGLLKDDLIFHAAIVFFGTTLAGVFNLLYHLVTVRLLSPQDYGAFNALVSFIMFTSMAVTPLGTTLTRFFTEYIAKKEFIYLVSVFKKLIKRLLLSSLFVFLFFFVFSPQIAKFLKVETGYVTLCGGIIGLSLVAPVIISLLQSFQKFKSFSVIGILSSLGKLVVGGALMFAGFKIWGGIMGFLVGPITIIFVALFFLPRLFRRELKSVSLSDYAPVNIVPIYKYFFPVAVALLSFTFLTTMDVILVKHFFSALEAGYYSIAQMVGKIVLFLPSALAIVILPKSTKAHVTNSSSTRILYKSLGLAGICCFCFITGAFLFPGVLLKVLTGAVNPVSRELVGLFALSMGFYALTWIVINFLLATHNLKFVLPLLVITILEAMAIYNCHSSLTMVLYILLVFSIISLFSSLFVVKISHKR